MVPMRTAHGWRGNEWPGRPRHLTAAPSPHPRARPRTENYVPHPAGSPQSLRVAMVGYAFMGAAHSQAWRTVNRVFDLPAMAVMQVLCGRHKERVQAAAQQLGWAEIETDWRRLVERDDIDVIDICTPGDSHEQIA